MILPHAHSTTRWRESGPKVKWSNEAGKTGTRVCTKGGEVKSRCQRWDSNPRPHSRTRILRSLSLESGALDRSATLTCLTPCTTNSQCRRNAMNCAAAAAAAAAAVAAAAHRTTTHTWSFASPLLAAPFTAPLLREAKWLACIMLAQALVS